MDEAAAWRAVSLVKILVAHQPRRNPMSPKIGRLQPPQKSAEILPTWLQDEDVQQFIQINRWQDVLWFHRESFEQLLAWMETITHLTILSDPTLDASEQTGQLAAVAEIMRELREAMEKSEYQVEKLLQAVDQTVKSRI